jgi:outer membrane lipoprotein carrier protein
MDRAKCWFHRRLQTTEALALAVLFVGHSLSVAEAQSETPNLHQADASVEASVAGGNTWPPELRDFVEQVTSFRADFVQELWSDDQQLIEVAQGTVELMRPGRFRWHYDEPYEQLIVADGRNLWMYDVDISQVTRSDLDVNDAGNPSALLSGDADIMQRFRVLDTSRIGEMVTVALLPEAAGSDYSVIRVSFSRASGDVAVLSSLEFVDGLDQTTVIVFQDAEVNPDLAPDRFDFEVPTGAHVLGGLD